MFIFRQKVNVELKCGVSTLQTGPLWRGFTMSLAQDFQGLEKVSVLANFHFKEYCKSSNERSGRLLILKILGGVFIGGRRLKKGGVYKIFSGEEIL